MKITVLGTGYVGLVAGACLSDTETTLPALMLMQRRLKNGELPISEPGLEGIVLRNLRAKRLRIVTDGRDAIRKVKRCSSRWNPQSEDGSSDLRYVLSAVENGLVIMWSTRRC